MKRKEKEKKKKNLEGQFMTLLVDLPDISANINCLEI